MTIPEKLVGAWRRCGVLIDGARVVDKLDRLWLQTPEWFADIRIKLDPVDDPRDRGLPGFLSREDAFAGVARWAEPVITWDHMLGVGPPRAVDDSSPLVWADGVVQEHGTTLIGSVEHTFVEEWIRMTDRDVTWSTEFTDLGVRVEVGRWAIEVRDEQPFGDFTATRGELHDGEWRRVHKLVVPALSPKEPQAGPP